MNISNNLCIDIDVVFFDLFFTLITPGYNNIKNEYDVLSITQLEWEKYSEDNELYEKRATGKVTDPQKIIECIINKMQIYINECDKDEILKLREDRFRNSLINVDPLILEVLSEIKRNGKQLCLISNADVIDVMYWKESPLCKLFNTVIFSYEVGCLKPQSEIYEIALKKMNTTPDKCIFIGDGGSDELKGAKQLGIKTIQSGYLVKRDNVQPNKLGKYTDYYIDDFKEIKNILL